jgi:hypothetical protein
MSPSSGGNFQIWSNRSVLVLDSTEKVSPEDGGRMYQLLSHRPS